jgi:hypothetical protein
MRKDRTRADVVLWLMADHIYGLFSTLVGNLGTVSPCLVSEPTNHESSVLDFVVGIQVSHLRKQHHPSFFMAEMRIFLF